MWRVVSNDWPNTDLAPEFFLDLAHQGILDALAVFDLAPWELPQATQVRGFGAPGQQERVVAFDHGGTDDDRVHQGSFRTMASSATNPDRRAGLDGVAVQHGDGQQSTARRGTSTRL